MQGIPPEVCEHTIPMKPDAKPVHQRPYPMNPKYASQIQEEINKLIDVDSFMRLNIRLGYRPSWWSLRRMGNLESALISRKWMLQPAVIITHYLLVSMFLKGWQGRKHIVSWMVTPGITKYLLLLRRTNQKLLSSLSTECLLSSECHSVWLMHPQHFRGLWTMHSGNS